MTQAREPERGPLKAVTGDVVQPPRAVIETVRFDWIAVDDPDSPGECTCGHLHFLRQSYGLNQVTWAYCEDANCRCRLFREAGSVTPPRGGS